MIFRRLYLVKQCYVVTSLQGEHSGVTLWLTLRERHWKTPLIDATSDVSTTSKSPEWLPDRAIKTVSSIYQSPPLLLQSNANSRSLSPKATIICHALCTLDTPKSLIGLGGRKYSSTAMKVKTSFQSWERESPTISPSNKRKDRDHHGSLKR